MTKAGYCAILFEAVEGRKFMFSFQDYRKIISIIKSTGRYMGYKESLGRDKFIIIRHDVEYSVFFSVPIILTISFRGKIWKWCRICMREGMSLVCTMH